MPSHVAQCLIVALWLTALPWAECLTLPQAVTRQTLADFAPDLPLLGGEPLSPLPPENFSQASLLLSNDSGNSSAGTEGVLLNMTLLSNEMPLGAENTSLGANDLTVNSWAVHTPTLSPMPSQVVHLSSHADVHSTLGENLSSDATVFVFNQSSETYADMQDAFGENASSNATAVAANQSSETTVGTDDGGLVVASAGTDPVSLFGLSTWVPATAPSANYSRKPVLLHTGGEAAARREGSLQAATKSSASVDAANTSNATDSESPPSLIPPSAAIGMPRLGHRRPGWLVTEGSTSTIVAPGQFTSSGEEPLPLALRTILVILAIAVLLLCGVVGIERSARTPPAVDLDPSTQVRQWVRSLAVQNPEDVKSTFRARSGYDCLLFQPQAPGIPARIEGVVAASPDAVLRAPMTRRTCVLFSASASEVRLDGVRAPPIAFTSMNTDFYIDLRMPGKLETLRIQVRGRDVALFDVASGWRRERSVLREASEHLQDFVHAHRATGTQDPSGSEVLDFTECLLDVGATVTCVGELRREHTGVLGLWPLQAGMGELITADTNRILGGLPGLTSWERADAGGSRGVEKVMISDDPGLLGHGSTSAISLLACCAGKR